jgi:hypothetical protein
MARIEAKLGLTICSVKLQLLSDLHLETEAFDPEPAPGAEVLVLAGDIDATWAGLARFAGWPVPVLFVPGNHEFDGRASTGGAGAARPAPALGIRLLHRESLVIDRRRRPARALRRRRALERLRPLRRGPARTRDARGRLLHAPDGRHAPRPPVRRRGVRERAWPTAPGWIGELTQIPQGRWDAPWWSRTSRPACAVPTRAMAASPAPPASAMPTTT